MNKKKISIVNPCFNEEDNVEYIYRAIKQVMMDLPQYEYEHIFADNCSSDRTVEILEKIAAEDKRVKVIENLRNFGADRSGANALYATTGDAVVCLASDGQDPPEMISLFIEKWAEGNKIVLGQKTKSKTNYFVRVIRSLYYKIIKFMSENEEIEQITGFGIYDREVINWFKEIDDPEPFMRNVITELGYKPYLIPYEQLKRMSGKSSYNFFRYVDTALNSLTLTTKVPLRIATYIGFITAFISIIIGFIYLIMKLRYWDTFTAGIAPLTIGIFFFSSVQLICLGIVGEYVGAVLTRVKRRPLVVEKKRVNFDDGETE